MHPGGTGSAGAIQTVPRRGIAPLLPRFTDPVTSPSALVQRGAARSKGHSHCGQYGAVAVPSRVVIRAARADDDAALQRVDATTWSSAVSPVPPPQQTRSFFDSTTVDEVIAAELGSEIVGYVKLGPFYKIDASTHVVELKGLAVDPDHQRSGIGTLLVQAAIGAARRRKARRIVLRVLASNPTARRLYERCGFKVEGILREQFLLNDRYIDDVLMALDLTALK
jgi:ribosomal protein S18 acetylase RimI-like enzyme